MHVSNLEGPRHSLAWPIYSCGHGSEHWYSSGNDLVFLVVQLYICWRLKLLRPVKAQSLPLQSSKSLLENLSFTVKKNMCFTFVLKFPWSSFFTRRPLPPSATSCSFEVVTSFGTAVAVVIFCFRDDWCAMRALRAMVLLKHQLKHTGCAQICCKNIFRQILGFALHTGFSLYLEERKYRPLPDLEDNQRTQRSRLPDPDSRLQND